MATAAQQMKIRHYFHRDVPSEVRLAVRWATGGFEKVVGVRRRVSVHVANTKTLIKPDGGRVLGCCLFYQAPEKPARIDVAAWCGFDLRKPVVPLKDVLTVLVFVVTHELVHFEWECKGKKVHVESRVNHRAFQVLKKIAQVSPPLWSRDETLIRVGGNQ